MKILIRADANLGIGIGHFSRLATLIAEAPQHLTFILACSKESVPFAKMIFGLSKNIVLRPIHTTVGQSHLPTAEEEKINDAVQINEIIKENKINLLIVDQYQIDELWLNFLDMRPIVIKINDVYDKGSKFDVQICPVLIDDHKGRTTTQSRLDFVGSKYILIGQGWRDTQKPRVSKTDNLIINSCFGFGNFSKKHFELLRFVVKNSISKPRKLNIFASKITNDDKLRLSNLANFVEDINIYLNETNLAKYFKEPCIGIGGGGISSIERCCVGAPSINFILAENQRTNVCMLEQEKCAFNGGHLENWDKLKLQVYIEKIMEIDNYLLMRENAFNLVDGLGAQRIWNRLKNVGVV